MDDGRLLRYGTRGAFGFVFWLVDTDSHALILGPEPLSEEFSGDYLFERSRKKTSR